MFLTWIILVITGSRIQSLPSPGGYSPRFSHEYYKLRSFSIKVAFPSYLPMHNLITQQKGRVIKLGDSMESRKSRTTSYNASPSNTSGGQSPR